MKSFLKWMSGAIALTAILLIALPAQKAQAQDDYVSYQTFYDDLAPYGQWVNDPQYGNVWVPEVDNDFRPYYSRGYWAATDYGNTWVSDYPWGWAAFHYGRWTYNPFYGWVWIPGNTWGPAWVSWRSGGSNYGWAPLGPGISLSVGIGNYSCPTDWWVFVGPQYLYQRNFHSHWRGPRYNNTYINQTTIINNTYNNTYVYGPRPRDIERVTNQRVNVHRVASGQRGRTVVNNNTVNVYRPQIRGNAADVRPRGAVQAPRSIGQPQSVRSTSPEFRSMVSKGELRPVSGSRNATSQQAAGREQRFDSRPDRTNQVRPERVERAQTERPQMQQRPERQQMQQSQRMERPQMQQRPERPQMQQPQRMERPQMQQRPERQQMQQPQRMERPQMQQRPERQQMQQPQRMERPQMQQRPERQQMQQPQRMERPQMQQRIERSEPQQRVERPQMQQQRSQPSPRPQPQQQSRSGSGERGRR